jgi:hypothetical protein
MTFLCIDQHGYRDLLSDVQKRTGGRVIKATFCEALASITRHNCDIAVLDVDAFQELPAESRSIIQDLPASLQTGFSLMGHCNSYLALRDIMQSEWAQCHTIIVWTKTPKKQFERLAARAGVPDVGRIRYYAKDKLEVPAELDCIRQQIIEDPQYIGYDFKEHFPKAVSAKWIRTHPSVFYYFEERVKNILTDPKGRDPKQILGELPRGYQWVYLLWRCYGSISNGGIEQFLCSSFSEDDSGQMIVDTLDMLRRFEMHDLAESLQEGIVVNSATVPNHVIALLSNRLDRKAETMLAASSRTTLDSEDRNRILNRKFSDLNYSFLKKFYIYAKDHPEYFVSAKPRHRRKRRADDGPKSTKRRNV